MVGIELIMLGIRTFNKSNQTIRSCVWKKKKKLEREKTGIVCTFASTDDQYCNDLNVKMFVVFSQSLLRVHSTLGNVHISRYKRGC